MIKELAVFLEGLTEGYIAPLFEIIIAIVITLGIELNQAISIVFSSQSISVPTIPIGFIFIIFIAIDWIRNLILGFVGPISAIGYAIGALFSISLLLPLMLKIAPDSVFAAIGLITFMALGVVVRFYVALKSSLYV